jgi:MSHA biogenesis protein MshL
VLVIAALAVSACNSNPYRWDSTVEKKIDETLAHDVKSATGSAVPADVSQALLPSSGGQGPQGAAAEPRFDLTVNNAPVRQVLLSMCEGTPYSVVLPTDMSGTLSLNLKAVTVPEAMQVVRSVYGYDFRREGNRFLMYGRGIQTRMFPVNYLNLARKGISLTRVSTGELTRSGATAGTAPTPATGTTPGTPGVPGTAATQATSGFRVQTDSKADFWSELQDALDIFIGATVHYEANHRMVAYPQGRKVMVNPQAGLVMVRAMPEELRLIEDYLNLMQLTVNRQVILEAKVIEVELKDGFQTGINWSALSGNTTFGQVGGGTIFKPGGISEIAGNTGNLNPGAPFSAISGTNASAFGGVFSAAIQTTNFAAFLELLKSQGNVHVLSSPRVSTVNNQKAVIKVGTDEFFITSTTVTPSNVSGQPPIITAELTPFFSGISLDVTPQIDDGSNIILHVHPAVSEVTQKDRTFKTSDQVNSLPTASNSIQESDNIVRAANGQIIVIGGLMKEGSTDDDAGVPLFGDIPVLGNAFKHKRITRIKRELVILLKPTIVDNDQVWGTAMRDSQGRIEKLKR